MNAPLSHPPDMPPAPHRPARWLQHAAAALKRWGRAAVALALGAALLASGQPPAALAAPSIPTPLPLLVFAGQSNMIGWLSNVADLSPAQQQPQPNVLFYGPNENGSTWGSLTPPTVLTNSFGVNSNVGFGPEISTGQALTAFPGFGLVAEVKLAESGTDLDYWWKPGNPSYNRMMARVAAAKAALALAHPDKAVYIAGFFWMQGEQDALNVGDAATRYEDNLTDLIAALRAAWSEPDLPVVIGQILGGHHEAGLVRAAQANVAATVPNVALVLTDDLPHETQDGIHFTSAGIVQLGERMGEAFARLAILTRKVYLPLTMR